MACILIVDDNPTVRLITRVVLEGGDHHVLEAENGLRIEETVLQHKPDLVITDMVMPDRDGVETVLALRQRFPELRIIAMSGGGSGGTLDLNVVKKLGVAATFAKPIAADALRQLVSEVLAAPPGQATVVRP
jgi:CheY-like chemotaxis protein